MIKSNKLVVFTAPSGAGKTTLVRHLLNVNDNLAFSVSATTRKRREEEIHGKDYFFVSIEEFKSKIEENAFVEWEQVYDGLYYGTLQSEVEKLWKENKTVIFDIDVQGAMNLKKKYGDRCFTIFVRPPSFDVLVERLQARNTESEESLKKRIDKVKREIIYEHFFDAVIINDKLDIAKKEAEILIDNFLIN
jgi:guanylate kinase